MRRTNKLPTLIRQAEGVKFVSFIPHYILTKVHRLLKAAMVRFDAALDKTVAAVDVLPKTRVSNPLSYALRPVLTHPRIKAILGAKVGQKVSVQTPVGESVCEIAAID